MEHSIPHRLNKMIRTIVVSVIYVILLSSAFSTSGTRSTLEEIILESDSIYQLSVVGRARLEVELGSTTLELLRCKVIDSYTEPSQVVVERNHLCLVVPVGENFPHLVEGERYIVALFDNSPIPLLTAKECVFMIDQEDSVLLGTGKKLPLGDLIEDIHSINIMTSESEDE